MKRSSLVVPLAVFAAAAVSYPSLAATPRSASVVVRHQLRACHTWSLNGGVYKADLAVRLARGGTLRITNNDLMVQKLIQWSGRGVRMRTIAHDHMKMVGLHKITGRGVMNHMGAALEVTFPAAGVYRFSMEDLGDYFELKEVGESNRLTLTVRVT